jgi:hypothetical protein
VLGLRVQGLSQRAIGDRLGVSQPMVCKILARVEERALRELTATVELIKARQTMALDHIACEALQAWERSKRPARSRNTVVDADGRRRERTVKGQCGDPRFLAEARGALAEVRAIWGLARPEPPRGETLPEIDDADPDVLPR